MPDEPTPFQESNALLALLRDDRDRAEGILAEMLPGERIMLASACRRLLDLIRWFENDWRVKEGAEDALEP